MHPDHGLRADLLAVHPDHGLRADLLAVQIATQLARMHPGRGLMAVITS
jgi:hypothetical protein